MPLIQLLFNVAFVSFKKGLLSANQEPEKEIETMSAKDLDEDDDDDSEPLLGMISHKKSQITILVTSKKFDIFVKKKINSNRFWFIFGIKLRIESKLH